MKKLSKKKRKLKKKQAMASKQKEKEMKELQKLRNEKELKNERTRLMNNERLELRKQTLLNHIRISNEKIESYQKQLSDLGIHLNNGKILLQKAANEISVLRKDNALLNTALQKYNSLTLVDICKSWDNCINPHYDCNNCPLAGTENPFIKHNFLSGNLSAKNLTTKL